MSWGRVSTRGEGRGVQVNKDHQEATLGHCFDSDPTTTPHTVHQHHYNHSPTHCPPQQPQPHTLSTNTTTIAPSLLLQLPSCETKQNVSTWREKISRCMIFLSTKENSRPRVEVSVVSHTSTAATPAHVTCIHTLTGATAAQWSIPCHIRSQEHTGVILKPGEDTYEVIFKVM